MENSKITDYSSFLYQLPSRATDKDYQKLSSRLKAFVQSPKFIRQGSMVDEYDPDTGRRIERPVSNVVYKETLEDQEGLPAQELRQLINRSIRQNDKKAMQQAAKYQFFSADKFVTQKQRAKQEDRKKRKRIILTSLAFGVPLSVLLGSLPFSNAKRMNQKLDTKHYANSAKLAVLGLLAGTGAAGLIEGARS